MTGGRGVSLLGRIARATLDAKQELGTGWNSVGPRIQQAFVALHAMRILASRDGDSKWQEAADFALQVLLPAPDRILSK